MITSRIFCIESQCSLLPLYRYLIDKLYQMLQISINLSIIETRVKYNLNSIEYIYIYIIVARR